MSAINPERDRAIDQFLHRAGWENGVRHALAADASFRRYERIEDRRHHAVLMDAPPPKEDVRPFVHVTDLLKSMDVSVPTILAADEDQGFLLLEDLGDQSFSRVVRENKQREPEIYRAAIGALAAIYHHSKLHGSEYARKLKPYDMGVYLREVALFSDWFMPQAVGRVRAMELRDEYLALWQTILGSAKLQQSCLVHRDYHADNLFWLDGRSGHKAVGILDYQDALWGDPAYDLASLLEDARRDVDAALTADCFAVFSTVVGQQAQDFAMRYNVLAAQRNAKIIGIFTRLCVRDGKAHYLEFLPRVWKHFLHDLRHPQLAPMRSFIEKNVPLEWRGVYTPQPHLGSIEA